MFNVIRCQCGQTCSALNIVCVCVCMCALWPCFQSLTTASHLLPAERLPFTSPPSGQATNLSEGHLNWQSCPHPSLPVPLFLPPPWQRLMVPYYIFFCIHSQCLCPTLSASFFFLHLSEASMCHLFSCALWPFSSLLLPVSSSSLLTLQLPSLCRSCLMQVHANIYTPCLWGRAITAFNQRMNANTKPKRSLSFKTFNLKKFKTT